MIPNAYESEMRENILDNGQPKKTLTKFGVETMSTSI